MPIKALQQLTILNKILEDDHKLNQKAAFYNAFLKLLKNNQ